MKTDPVDSQMVAGAADWLRVACARAAGNAGERRAFETNEEVAEIKRRIGTETKETETAQNRLRLGVGVLVEGCKNSQCDAQGQVWTRVHWQH
jgi:hypothetical protein